MGKVMVLRLKELREKAGLSQAQLAAQCGLSRRMVQLLEHQQAGLDFRRLAPICEVLKCKPIDLLKLEESQVDHQEQQPAPGAAVSRPGKGKAGAGRGK